MKANSRVKVQIKAVIQNEFHRLMTTAMQLTLKLTLPWLMHDIQIMKTMTLHTSINYSETAIKEMKPFYKYCETKKVFDYMWHQNEAELESWVEMLCTKSSLAL